MLHDFARLRRTASPAPRPPAPPSRLSLPAFSRRPLPADDPFPIYLIEPELSLRVAVTRDLRAAAFDVRPFGTLDDFTIALPDLEPGCIVLDVGALPPSVAGVEQEAVYRAVGCPTILIFASLEVEDAVRAMRLGAADVLVRPVSLDELIAALRRAAPRVREQKQRIAALRDKAAVDSLSPREREVMNGIMIGLSNKEMARELGLSPRTVEMHRARLHRRLGISCLAALLALAWRARTVDEG